MRKTWENLLIGNLFIENLFTWISSIHMDTDESHRHKSDFFQMNHGHIVYFFQMNQIFFKWIMDTDQTIFTWITWVTWTQIYSHESFLFIENLCTWILWIDFQWKKSDLYHMKSIHYKSIHMRKSWKSQGWKSHGKVTWESHGKVIGKSMLSLETPFIGKSIHWIHTIHKLYSSETQWTIHKILFIGKSMMSYISK